jgi:hypothetical protein
LCGLDCEELFYYLKILKYEDHDRWELLIKELKIPKTRANGSLWDMDHILPVYEGGGCCGMENLRTLCIWCHHIENEKIRVKISSKNGRKLDGSKKGS